MKNHHTMKTILLSIFFITACSLYGQTNLIKNGGFENEFMHWDNIVENGARANFSTDPRNKQIGRYAFKVQVNSLGKDPWSVQCSQGFLSKKDKTYKLSFLAKSNSSGNKMVIQIQNKTYTPKTFTLTNQWIEYIWQFTAKENNLQISMQFPQKGTFFVDNLIIKEARRFKKTKINKSFRPKPSISSTNSRNTSSNKSSSKKSSSTGSSSNNIYNGDFEIGYEGWNNISEEGGQTEYKFNSQTPHGGKKAMRVVVMQFGQNPWSIQSIKSINVKKNKRYRVSFYAKAGGRNKKAKVQIQDHPKKIYLPFEFATSTSWQKYEFEFNADSDTMELTLQHISSGIMEYDDISIQMIGKKR